MPGMDDLPSELVSMTLEYLGPADLRAAAGVSRTFYTSAWRAGLYIHRNMDKDACTRKYAVLDGIIEHVMKKDLRLSLFVYLLSPCPFFERGSDTSPLVQKNHFVIPLMFAALPALVYLSISVYNKHVPSLLEALHHTAPHLAEFKLVVQNCGGRRSEKIPADIFARSAPKLRRLSLRDIDLLHDSVPAFSLVDSVELCYHIYSGQLADIDYQHHFPRLQSLLLLCWGNFDGLPPPRLFRFGGLRLRRLNVEEEETYPLMPALCESINLANVANVEHVTRAVAINSIDWADPLWSRKDDGLVSMRVTQRREEFGIDITVVPHHRRWRRAFGLWWDKRAPLPGIDMPGYSERIAYLRMHAAHISSLLMCRDVTLRALRRLQVDIPAPSPEEDGVVWPVDLQRPLAEERSSKRNQPAGREWHHVDCGTLETLTPFAMDPELVVESDDIICLARALALFRRRKRDRAALDLVGIELTALTPVRQTFSAVRKHDFAGGDSAAGQDGGLWDDED